MPTAETAAERQIRELEERIIEEEIVATKLEQDGRLDEAAAHREFIDSLWTARDRTRLRLSIARKIANDNR